MQNIHQWSETSGVTAFFKFKHQSDIFYEDNGVPHGFTIFITLTLSNRYQWHLRGNNTPILI